MFKAIEQSHSLEDSSAPTAALARLAARTVALPADVDHAARRCFVNILANMVGGSTDPDIERMLNANSSVMGAPTATILGFARKADPATAAALNAASGNILDFDDTHPATLIHPSAPVLAAILPIAEARGAAIPEVLLALALGAEVAVRIGLALGPEHYANGWHITATCGTIGAAAAAAKMLGLDETGIRNAIGTACTQASGIAANFGYTAKSIGVGGAARNGLHAAYYAQAGIDASPIALEGPNGFLRVASPKPDETLIAHGLGEVWACIATSPKPYPTCVFLHPVVDAIIELRRQLTERPEIDRVIVHGNPLMLSITDRNLPTNGHEARLSMHHSVAVAWMAGTAGISDFSDAAVEDAALQCLAKRVYAVADESIAPESARVRIEFKNGASREVFIPAGRGSERRPLTDEELLQKCIELARAKLAISSAEALISLCWSGSGHNDLARVLDLGACRVDG